MLLNNSVKTASTSLTGSIIAVSLVTSKNTSDLSSASITITNTPVVDSNTTTTTQSSKNLNSKLKRRIDDSKPNKSALHISTSSSVSSSSNFSSQSTSPSSSSFTSYIQASQLNPSDLPLNTTTRLNNNDFLLHSNDTNSSLLIMPVNTISSSSSSYLISDTPLSFKSSLRARKVFNI